LDFDLMDMKYFRLIVVIVSQFDYTVQHATRKYFKKESPGSCEPEA
jgi:hypothetical protein